jgi:hypothetical protein
MLAVILPLAGLGLLTLGLLSDQGGWWSTRPFLTNLISGLTSACFGVPFALLVLTSLTARQTRELERRGAETLFAGAVSSLVTLSERITVGPEHDRLDVALDALTRSSLRRLDALDPSESTRAELLELSDVLSALGRFLADNLSYPLDMREHWAALCAQWRFLDDHVKPTMLAQQLDWLRPDIAARLETLLAAGAHPFLPAVVLRDELLPPVLARLRELAKSTDAELARRAGTAEVRTERNRLRDGLVAVRSHLPDAMRLRECVAVIRDRPFAVDLIPGDGLQI